MEISIELLSILFLTGLAAGLIDSIAGGGGLLTIPVLLWIGLPPALALGTNKLQGSIGTFTASLHYYRQGHIPIKSAMSAVILSFIGSGVGTFAVRQFDSSTLSTLIPFLLILFSVYFIFSPKMSDKDAKQLLSKHSFAFTAGLGIGFYDGFFGPGAGAFYMIAYITLLGYGIVKATAHTKLLNFSSNISALIFFQLMGFVSWPIGLSMGAGQILGSYLGSHLTMKHGLKLVKPILITVSVLMSVKLLLD